MTRNAGINIAACDFLIWSKDTQRVYVTLREKSMDFTSGTPRSDSAVYLLEEGGAKFKFLVARNF